MNHVTNDPRGGLWTSERTNEWANRVEWTLWHRAVTESRVPRESHYSKVTPDTFLYLCPRCSSLFILQKFESTTLQSTRKWAWPVNKQNKTFHCFFFFGDCFCRARQLAECDASVQLNCWKAPFDSPKRSPRCKSAPIKRAAQRAGFFLFQISRR